MATGANKIVVSDYDFDAIKVNLKNFLQGQVEFQDYDFTDVKFLGILAQKLIDPESKLTKLKEKAE